MERELSRDEQELLDQMAEITQAPDASFSRVLSAYEEEPGLRTPPVVKSYSPAAPKPLELRLRG
jgi:hypothetical protein